MLRSPDSSGNIYLQIAAFIEMGLQGIREKTDCRKLVMKPGRIAFRRRDKASETLPLSMFEALAEAENSRFLKQLLGKPLFDKYISSKVNEWKRRQAYVTPQERVMFCMNRR